MSPLAPREVPERTGQSCPEGKGEAQLRMAGRGGRGADRGKHGAPAEQIASASRECLESSPRVPEINRLHGPMLRDA